MSHKGGVAGTDMEHLKLSILLAEDEKNKIYQLPLDNMPWVQPKVTVTMPNILFDNKSIVVGKMPNPL